MQTTSGFSGGSQSAVRVRRGPPKVLRREQMLEETVPVKRFPCKVAAPKLAKVPRASGIVPVKKLLCSWRKKTFVNTPKNSTVPVRRLSLTSNCSSSKRFDISDGTEPVNAL